jgi:hypothetical protein
MSAVSRLGAALVVPDAVWRDLVFAAAVQARVEHAMCWDSPELADYLRAVHAELRARADGGP